MIYMLLNLGATPKTTYEVKADYFSDE